MTFQDEDFWGRMQSGMPGLLSVGAGLWGNRQARKEGEGALNAAQGPAYQQAMAASQNALSRAGSMDPKAMAQERFNAATGMLAGKDASDEQAMLRMLQKQGVLDVANYNPGVKGIDQSEVAMNPHMAAFYAGRGARDKQLAWDSLREGEALTDNLLTRSARAQQQAQSGRSGDYNIRNRAVPSKAASTNSMLAGLLQNRGVMKDLGGLLGSGASWLKNQLSGLGGSGGSSWFSSMDADSTDW